MVVSTRSRARRKSRGQSMVEFALVFPLFILLLAGMIDFGMGLFSYMSVINGAREGARYGATACTSVACAASVQQQASGAAGNGGVTLPTSDVSVTCTQMNAATPPVEVASDCTAAMAGSAVRSGGHITVRITYHYSMIWPLAFGTQIDETSTVKMRIE